MGRVARGGREEVDVDGEGRVGVVGIDGCFVSSWRMEANSPWTISLSFSTVAGATVSLLRSSNRMLSLRSVSSTMRFRCAGGEPDLMRCSSLLSPS